MKTALRRKRRPMKVLAYSGACSLEVTPCRVLFQKPCPSGFSLSTSRNVKWKARFPTCISTSFQSLMQQASSLCARDPLSSQATSRQVQNIYRYLENLSKGWNVPGWSTKKRHLRPYSLSHPTTHFDAAAVRMVMSKEAIVFFKTPRRLV